MCGVVKQIDIGMSQKGARFHVAFRDLSTNIWRLLASQGKNLISEKLRQRFECGRIETIRL